MQSTALLSRNLLVAMTIGLQHTPAYGSNWPGYCERADSAELNCMPCYATQILLEQPSLFFTLARDRLEARCSEFSSERRSAKFRLDTEFESSESG